MLPEDAAAVEIVEKACFAMPWSRQSFWKEAAKKDAHYLVAISTIDKIKQIIGYTGMWLVAYEAQITNVAVHPAYQAKGVASLLLKECLVYAKKQKLQAITLEVRISNHKAIHLYEKFGFKSVGIRPHYYLDNNEDAQIMWLIF